MQIDRSPLRSTEQALLGSYHQMGRRQKVRGWPPAGSSEGDGWGWLYCAAEGTAGAQYFDPVAHLSEHIFWIDGQAARYFSREGGVNYIRDGKRRENQSWTWLAFCINRIQSRAPSLRRWGRRRQSSGPRESGRWRRSAKGRQDYLKRNKNARYQ